MGEESPLADIPQDQVQVQPTVQPGVELPANASPDAFGATVGQALEGGAEVVTKLQHDAVSLANMAVAQDNQNKLADFESQRLYDPKTGVLNQKLGANAPGAVDKTLADHQKLTDDIAAGLSNDAQKAQFERLSGEHQRQMRRTLYAYENHEVNRWQDETSTANTTNHLNAMARNPEDVEGNVEHIARMRANAQADGERHGLPPEMIKSEVDSAAAAGHFTVIKSLVDGDHAGMAKSYFDKYRDELDAKTLGPAEAMLKTVTEHDEARSIADDITAKNKDRTNLLGEEDQTKPPVGLESQLAELDNRKIKNTAVYDQVKQRLMQNDRDQRMAHHDAQVDLGKKVTNAIDADPEFNKPAGDYALLDPEFKKDVDKYQDHMRKYGRIETVDTYKDDLLEKCRDPDKWSEFMAESDAAMKANLNRVDYAMFLKEREHIATQQKNQTKILSQGAMSSEEVSGLKQQYGLEEQPLKKGEDINSPERMAIAARWNNFQDQLQRVNAAQALEQKAPCTKEQVAANARMLFTSTTWREQLTKPTNAWSPGFGFLGIPHATVPVTEVEKKAPFFESPNAAKAAYRPGDIPEKERDSLVKRLEKGGLMKPTDRQLIDAYNLTLGINRAAP